MSESFNHESLCQSLGRITHSSGTHGNDDLVEKQGSHFFAKQKFIICTNFIIHAEQPHFLK